MRLTWFLIGTFSVWRVTHFLHSENGPWDAVARVRASAATRWLGRVLECFACLSVWVAAPIAVALAGRWWETVLVLPALSGGAMLLERVTSGDSHVPVAGQTHYPRAQNSKPGKPCCGGRKPQTVSHGGELQTSSLASVVSEENVGAARAAGFQYIGTTVLTVRGPVTGRRYVFRGYGAEVVVDGRDVASLRAVPELLCAREVSDVN